MKSATNLIQTKQVCCKKSCGAPPRPLPWMVEWDTNLACQLVPHLHGPEQRTRTGTRIRKLLLQQLQYTSINKYQQISTNINNQYIVNIQTATSMTRDFELQQFISYRAIQHETNIQQSNILCKIWSREVLNPFHFKGERGLFHNSIRNIRDVDSKRRFDLALERRYFSRESRACWSWSIFNIDQHGMIKPY